MVRSPEGFVPTTEEGGDLEGSRVNFALTPLTPKSGGSLDTGTGPKEVREEKREGFLCPWSPRGGSGREGHPPGVERKEEIVTGVVVVTHRVRITGHRLID